MVDKMGTCPICYEEFCLLKVLQCNHAYCAECIKKQFLPPGANQVANTVKCSLCLRTSSILPDGKVERLKSKLFVDLCCTNCYKDKSINDSWWCSICNLTVCSYCAIKKHKDHTLKEWKDFDVVKECYAMYKFNLENAQAVKEWRKSVHEFCVRLEERLVSLVDDVDSSKKALVSIEETFGYFEPICLPNGHTVEKLEQKLSTVSSLVQKISACSPLPKISNVVKKQKKHYSLPSVENVCELVETKTVARVV